MISRGIMSGITGNPADLIIIDDPVKNQQEADSPAYRNRVWSEWQASLKSRLAAKGKVVVIMTPWTDDDLAARIIRAEKNVQLVRLPVEAEENDPMGREPGEPLCPELGKDAQWLADFKASYISDPQGGQRAWTALYQCSPRAEDGNLVKREWWRFYDPEENIAFGTEMISVDASFKGDDTSDYVSIQVWGKRAQDYYLRYCLNKRLNFPDTLEAIRTIYRLFPRARQVLIEEAANGPAIIQTLQREMLIIPVTPLGGKISRVNAVSPAIESGHVFLPDPAKTPWVADYIDQWTAFPNSKNDDMVDATSQALARMIYSSGEVWEEKEQPVFDVNRLFDPYGYISSDG
ncbi:MAG: phage terminase large subunit [Clostridium sp.]|nr:phage terminase large subunit [Clostridium sp.]